MNPDFQVLTELYRFLAQFEPNAITAAAKRQTTSANIRIALEALAKEANLKNSPTAAKVQDLKSNGIVPSAKKDPKDYRNLLKHFLLDEKRFPDKTSLSQFAQKMGIPDASNSKFSRDRVANCIIQKAFKDEVFRDRLNDVIASMGGVDPQTRGWMNMILGNR